VIRGTTRTGMGTRTHGNRRQRKSWRGSKASGNTENQPLTEPQPQISKIERNPADNKAALWREQWSNGCKTARKLRKISRRPNIQPSPQIYNQLGNKRRHIAWIARLRTGHCSLNQYLERFNIIDDAKCRMRTSQGNSQTLFINLLEV
jgi:hypothetical protein